MWYVILKHGMAWEELKSFFFVFGYEELWRVSQIDLYLIIELYPFISKKQKLIFLLFLIINLLKCIHDVDVQWHLWVVNRHVHTKTDATQLCNNLNI